MTNRVLGSEIVVVESPCPVFDSGIEYVELKNSCQTTNFSSKYIYEIIFLKINAREGNIYNNMHALETCYFKISTSRLF